MNGVIKVERNVSIQEAAKEMRKSLQCIRIGLQRNIFEFGFAQKIPGSEKYTYYINPRKFFAYIGKELPMKYREPEEQTATAKYTVITDPTVARNISWRCRV